jgi:Trypsin-like peptidase domain
MQLYITSLIIFAAIGNGPPNWTVNSDWTTTYQDIQGGQQNAPIQLRNGVGSYGQQGRLLNTFYLEAVRHPRGDISAALIGEWRMGGRHGYFVFREPDRNGRMDGYWGSFDRWGRPTIVIGSWDGTLRRVLPRNNPVVIPVVAPRDEAPVDVPPLPQFANLPQAEAQFGVNSKLVDINWVKKLNERKLVVGALSLKEGMNVAIKGQQEFYPEGKQFGTCFLVGKGVAITAKHCVSGLSKPMQVYATFLHPTNQDGLETHALTANPIHLQTLDVAILVFDPQVGVWPSNFVSLTENLDQQGNLGIPQTKTPLIIQFPMGEKWRMSFQGEFIDKKEPDIYVRYTSTTSGGSSGSPVFGSDWQIMAVHSAADRDYNVGVRVDLLVKELRRTLSNDARNQHLLQQLGIR